VAGGEGRARHPGRAGNLRPSGPASPSDFGGRFAYCKAAELTYPRRVSFGHDSHDCCSVLSAGNLSVRRLWPGSRVIPRYSPALARFERSLRAVIGKDTETPSGCGAHSARAAGAKLALLPFQPRGKHPRREQRAPRFTPSSQINCPHELISFRFGSPSSQSRRTLPSLLIPSVALWRKLQS
jgi:hypothetical protein